jgi:ADP-ribosylglycohydrolase
MLERYEGAIVGLAIGDALGFPVEFIGADEIRRRFGPQGVTDFAPPRSHPPGTYTDDTQMSLAVAEALIRVGQEPPDTVAAAIAEELVRWAASPDNDRAPGSTTMSACRRLAAGRSWRESGVSESKGCGSTIRTAPIGLYYHADPERLVEVAANSSRITHGHPCAVAGAVANALAVALALQQVAPEAFVPTIVEMTGDLSSELAAKIAQVPEALPMAPDGAFDVLGDAWVAEEAVACALYCFLRHPRDFGAAVLTAVNASGDSDSIGSLAGGISGAYNGIEAIPGQWRARIENSTRLLSVARRLWEAHGT